MSPAPQPAARTENAARRSFFTRPVEWLLSPEYFHLKLLLGSAVGVVVILTLAIVCVVSTLQDQRLEQTRAHAIDVMRLSSVVENDIASLENSFRGHLLTKNAAYLQTTEQLQKEFLDHCEELNSVLADSSQQRKRVSKVRENVVNWLQNESLSIFRRNPDRAGLTGSALGAPELVDARQILQDIQRDEEILLNQRVQDQEWAIQSTQVLNFIPKMEQSASEMQKEKRGYQLTGDPSFIDGYKRATSDFYTFHGYLSVLVANDPKDVVALTQIREAMESWITQCAVPAIEARGRNQTSFDPAASARSQFLMGDVQDLIKQFERKQMELYQVRARAAARDRILKAAGIDLFCAIAAGLMIASSSYSFVISRRQLKKLDGADHRIRAVVENILDGMITLDERGTLFSMNPAAKQMFGFKESEYFGDEFTRLVPQWFTSEGQQAPCQWSDLAEKTGATFFAIARTRARQEFPVEISLSQMRIEQRDFYIAMIRDITEQKRFEQDLEAEKKRLAVTLSSIEDGVITIDLHGRIVVWNAAAATMTGYSVSEVVGHPLKTVFLSKGDPTRMRTQPLKTGFRNEAETILFTTPERSTLTSREGTERLIEQFVSPIRDGKNELQGVVLVFRDITERQRAEAERHKAEALEQLGLLAGGIAHDFNNLLTAIVGNISLAQMLLPPEDELCGRLADAKNASMRARDLAQQLLTFARGGAPIKKTASIANLIEETVSFSLRGSQSRGVLHIAPDVWTAEFDPGQISQVLANLVVNAEQAMPEGGNIQVECDNFQHDPQNAETIPDLAAGDYIRIRVRDEGVGIPPQYLKQIFDPYFTTKPKGNGLGLATSYSIVKNHHGLIVVESELHCGSTFTVYLPAATRRETVPAEPVNLPAADEPIDGAGRVLVVDDEEAIRALVEFTLTRLGYEVAGAETALEGIEVYRKALVAGRRFDLVILDLTLPGGMGGKEALKKLIEIDPTVNAIVSSGYAMDATMSRYEDFGFRGVIAKPYEAAELGRTVRHAIGASGQQSDPRLELQAV